ncbi:MAG: hypothetical protein ACO39W_05475, partial [Schleiferiaceae bacterium]
QDPFGIPVPETHLETLPLGNQVLYPLVEICLHSLWAWMGMRYLGLAPDLHTFLKRILQRLRP